MSRVECAFVYLHNRLQEGVRQKQASISVGIAGTFWHRDALHRSLEEMIR